MTRRHLTTIAVALALPLAGAGCGGGDEASGGSGLNRNDPEAVALAYARSYYDCGAKGAGLRWDLELKDGGEISRADTVGAEQKKGCRPVRVPQIETVRGQVVGDLVRVGIVNPDSCPHRDDVVLVLLRTGSGYMVDPAQSDLDAADCVEHGST